MGPQVLLRRTAVLLSLRNYGYYVEPLAVVELMQSLHRGFGETDGFLLQGVPRQQHGHAVVLANILYPECLARCQVVEEEVGQLCTLHKPRVFVGPLPRYRHAHLRPTVVIQVDVGYITGRYLVVIQS